MTRIPMSEPRMPQVAPSHINEQGGIDLSSECSCVRIPMVAPLVCPCTCHEDWWAQRVAHHRSLHAVPAGWCPACAAITAGESGDQRAG
jgi:hypothetical protein